MPVPCLKVKLAADEFANVCTHTVCEKILQTETLRELHRQNEILKGALISTQN